MSISSIAAQLYTIQTKKRVPLKTAFSMLVREDLAMRFSVYNLTKIITKSEFLATVAQTTFGDRTPLQRRQDEESNKKEKADAKFKQFTVRSIVNISRTLEIVKSVSERNSELINNLYSELGSFRGQRRIDPRLFTATAVRVPVTSKTVKGKLDELNKEIEKLKAMPKKAAKKNKGTVAAKKEKEKDQSSFITAFLPFLLKNPRLLMMLGGGAATAVGLGSFAAQAYSLYNLPGAFGRVAGRFSGKPGFEDPLTEQISQGVDTGVVGIGTYTAARLATAAGLFGRGRGGMSKAEADSLLKTAKNRLKQSRAELKGIGKAASSGQINLGQALRQQSIVKEKMKAQRVSVKEAMQAKKFSVVNSTFKGIAKRLPAFAAADVAITISRMSGFVADRTTGKMSQQEYKQNMVEGYSDLISTIGITGASTVLGSLVGTALFPGVGSFAGAAAGGLAGYVLSLFVEESSSIQALASKMFEMIHEDKTVRVIERQATIAREDNRRMLGGVAMPPSGRARPSTPILSSLLERGESKAFGGYTAYNTKVGNTFKAGKADLSKLSINEIMGAQSRGQFYAVGKYQLIPSTLKEAKEKLGLTGNEKFTPEIQEYIFANYLIGDKRPAIRDYLNGSSDNLDAALLALSQEWSSVSTEYDQMKSYYSKDKATISKREAANALMYERERRMSLREQGLDVSVMATPASTEIPGITTTPNMPVSSPPVIEQPVTSINETTDTQNAQIEAQAALKVSAAANEKVARVQEQLNNHDSRLGMQEKNSKVILSKNSEFEDRWGVKFSRIA